MGLDSVVLVHTETQVVDTVAAVQIVAQELDFVGILEVELDTVAVAERTSDQQQGH
jgi:hypothetical protein